MEGIGVTIRYEDDCPSEKSIEIDGFL